MATVNTGGHGAAPFSCIQVGDGDRELTGNLHLIGPFIKNRNFLHFFLRIIYVIGRKLYFENTVFISDIRPQSSQITQAYLDIQTVEEIQQRVTVFVSGNFRSAQFLITGRRRNRRFNRTDAHIQLLGLADNRSIVCSAGNDIHFFLRLKHIGKTSHTVPCFIQIYHALPVFAHNANDPVLLIQVVPVHTDQKFGISGVDLWDTHLVIAGQYLSNAPALQMMCRFDI